MVISLRDIFLVLAVIFACWAVYVLSIFLSRIMRYGVFVVLGVGFGNVFRIVPNTFLNLAIWVAGFCFICTVISLLPRINWTLSLCCNQFGIYYVVYLAFKLFYKDGVQSFGKQVIIYTICMVLSLVLLCEQIYKSDLEDLDNPILRIIDRVIASLMLTEMFLVVGNLLADLPDSNWFIIPFFVVSTVVIFVADIFAFNHFLKITKSIGAGVSATNAEIIRDLSSLASSSSSSSPSFSHTETSYPGEDQYWEPRNAYGRTAQEQEEEDFYLEKREREERGEFW